MKRFEQIIKVFLAVVLINLTTNLTAQNNHTEGMRMTEEDRGKDQANIKARFDLIDISILTCGPGDQVWSYYGHTALRIHDKTCGEDVVVNWGMFSFGQDYFVLRFIFGLTDYQMGITTMQEFLAEYANRGRWVKEQVICLSPEEKRAVLQAIEKNYRPENRKYRYNFFYDNCTTRARDIIFQAIGREQLTLPTQPQSTSYRKEIHKWNGNHRWARMGNDLLLGYQSDVDIDNESREFLPINMMDDLDLTARADFMRGDEGTTTSERTKNYIGAQTKLRFVTSSSYLVPPPAQVEETEAVTPIMVAWCIALVIAVLCGIELWKKSNFWWLDALLFVLTGLPGLILLAMVFSLHPTVQVNFQILILNPLNLVFVWKTVRMLRQGKVYGYYNVWGALLLLALFLQLWQHYAEGMEVLALSLLLRYCVVSIRYELKHKEIGNQ